MTIRAVLWDFGGVITTSPFESFRRFEQEQGLPLDLIRTINSTNPDNNAKRLLGPDTNGTNTTLNETTPSFYFYETTQDSELKILQQQMKSLLYTEKDVKSVSAFSNNLTFTFILEIKFKIQELVTTAMQ